MRGWLTDSQLAANTRWPRALGLGLGGLTIGAALLQRGEPWGWAYGLLVHALIWPHLAHVSARRHESPAAAERRNLLIDALLGGTWLPAIGFNLLPTALVATMMAVSSVAVGGARLLARGAQAMAGGIAMGWAVWGTHLELAPSVTTLVACLPLLVLYPLAMGAMSRRLATQLGQKKRALERSEALQRTVLNALQAGIVLYDADDRLVICNQDFRELYGPIAHLLEPGITFEALLRRAVGEGLVPEAIGREDEWIRQRLLSHAIPQSAVQRELPGGRWRRIVEKRLPDGSLLAFSTDVTELVLRERELQSLVTQRDAYAQALRQANDHLAMLSDTDALTGIANRRQFDRRLRDECRRARRNKTPMALLMIDVDHFKRFNDLHGHPAGDQCLRLVANALKSCAQRAVDLAARYGGEEFALLLPHTTEQEAVTIAQRCMAAIACAAIPHGDSPTGPVVTISVGLATARTSEDGDIDHALTRDADRALYLAKDRGRNRLATFSSV
ncbi:MAG TPA: diguanylate cyclase [Ideonella sp.]|uniref:diguanylate cyclase domain-containing protein n=1 Tax=Ideonella sp. TaxID=1929293 RepID=UPI002E356BC8|nr:diguanylate cyclase [Ideonella sp.]HEX5687516.1 diguanylate cyclase [Ideonella sp.]